MRLQLWNLLNEYPEFIWFSKKRYIFKGVVVLSILFNLKVDARLKNFVIYGKVIFLTFFSSLSVCLTMCSSKEK